MKFEDDTQNLKIRMAVIHGLVLAVLVVLGARLYFLQVVSGDYYAERAENQRIRRLRIPAPRGAIFDRSGKLLVDSRSTYNILLSGEDMKGKDWGELVAPLSEGLDLDPGLLRERFDEAAHQAAFEEVTVKEGAAPADIAWVEAHTLELPMLLVREQPQRRYPDNGTLAHVLGYVGEIGPEQLKQPRFKDPEVNPFVKDNPYRPGDIIGQEGLESTYDRYLRGRDGYREVEVDSRGRIQRDLAVVPPQPGQDLVTTIDLDIQLKAEEQLRNSPNKRGVIVVMEPQSGEILAMASYPTFDPNLFSQRIGTPEGRKEANALLRDPTTPLFNRAIRGRYPPGSTWKIPMAVAGLQQGAITMKNSHLACGGGIQIGNKFTRCMGSHGSPELRTAIRVSCDGYFYRLGLKMGLDGIMKMVDEFDINKRTGVDLPHELVSWTPSREFKARFNPHDAEWKDIDTVYASFGQVYDFVTPLAMLRAQAAIANGGRLYVPHLLKEARPVSAVGPFAAKPRQTFDHPEPKLLDIPADQHALVVDGMWAVVNEAGGTGGAARIEGFNVAGKTGTAQVVGLGKDTGKNKDHSWFVSYAPAQKPEIAMIALIENVGFGGKFAAPAVHNVYQAYLAKAHPELAPPQAAANVVARKQ
ncbi:MAG: penicillin-binding protein 2 [Acidobacteriota bacterium]|jgi:penicillin-binding protein 2|nr:penicillin-binding protein 2 [Acidobacteriota bacterium]MDT7809423.1 penicillin-binding protein 2 [Acidobacteriota bacterium]